MTNLLMFFQALDVNNVAITHLNEKMDDYYLAASMQISNEMFINHTLTLSSIVNQLDNLYIGVQSLLQNKLTPLIIAPNVFENVQTSIG